MTFKDGFKLGCGIIAAQLVINIAMNLIIRIVSMIVMRG